MLKQHTERKGLRSVLGPKKGHVKPVYALLQFKRH